MIKIEAEINAGIEKVWDCFTKPEHIVNWNFAADDWQCPRAENDLRVGGKLSSRMEAKDGSFGFDFNCVYKEIVTKKKLSLEMEDGRKWFVYFEAQGDKTIVVEEFDPESQNPHEMQQAGWQMILNNFKKYTENH